MTKFLPLHNPKECLGTNLFPGSRECSLASRCVHQDRRMQPSNFPNGGQPRCVSVCAHPKVEEIIKGQSRENQELGVYDA